jgi:tetratricopeptide (TPR) repeat protein
MRTDSVLSTQVVSADAKELLTALKPSLVGGRMEEAMLCVRKRWTCSQILGLIADKSAEVRQVAALALSMIGDASAVRPLAVALHDAEAAVAQVAEHALWSIWFRLGKPTAVSLVKCGNTHLYHGNYSSAIEKFSQAIQADETFAEAYNQRAIAFYLTERYADSMDDGKRALARMPQHFQAMASVGHCFAHLRNWKEAKRCYRLALAIHPRQEGIETSLAQVEQLLKDCGRAG